MITLFLEDSVSAIVNLGYSKSDAYKAVNLIKDEFKIPKKKKKKNDDKISVEKDSSISS